MIDHTIGMMECKKNDKIIWRKFSIVRDVNITPGLQYLDTVAVCTPELFENELLVEMIGDPIPTIVVAKERNRYHTFTGREHPGEWE